MLNCLRISVTGLSLTACVLLIALWVRSYWRLDIVEKLIGLQAVQVSSVIGRIAIGQLDPAHNNREVLSECRSRRCSRLEEGKCIRFCIL